MKNTFFDLVEQTFYFPQEGFDLHGDYLQFHGVSLKYLIEKYAPHSLQLVLGRSFWICSPVSAIAYLPPSMSRKMVSLMAIAASGWYMMSTSAPA